ncbi:uncharacterized protein LOC103848585 [Brassica rapa]|uniref:uncharacterized protein LOC103848585 n=1 Tax=Brassica campestris TaxID=3711 RepID=UPI00142E0F88|nr:uncharacterized protein LOC103848585 [Brassica rapa]
MDAAEVKSGDYPPKLYPEGSSNLDGKVINHNFHPGHFPHVRETIGLDVWEELVNSPIGVVARLAERKSMWSGRTVHYLLCRQLRVIKKEIWCLVADEAIRFSLLEFGEITGLNTGPLPTEKFDPSQYNEFWGELKVPLGMGPKLDELKAALAFCPRWSFEKRKWLGLLLLQAMEVYCLHHNSGIPFQSAIKVFYDEAMRSYPWSQTAYEVLIDSIKTLAPDGGSYTISGMKDALLIWAYESVTCFGESFGRVIINEDVPLLRWGGKCTRASFDKLLSSEIEKHGELMAEFCVSLEAEFCYNLVLQGNAKGKGKVKGKGNEKKRMKGGVLSEAEPPTKKQKKVKTQNESEADAAGNESEADAAGKGSSEKEGSKELELENKTTLTTIVNTLDIISRKFDHVDSRLEAYELDRNIPLMDQKTIDDRVNALLEERLKDLGIRKIPENHDNPSPPLSNPSPPLSKASPVVRTHQKSVNSPALVDAAPRPKKNLAKELEKESGATKDDKSTKDDKAAKDPAYGRGCRRTRIVKGEEADEKKKTAQADAAFKRKEKAEAKKKAAEEKKKEAEAKKTVAAAKKKVAEAKKKVAELKKQSQARSKYKKVTPPRDGVTRCNVQPDVEDSSLADITDEVVVEQNEFAPESDVENSELVRSAIIKEFWEKYVQLTSKGLSTTAVSSSFDFPTVGHDGTTCMRKNVTPSSAIYDPLAPDYPALLEKLMQHIKAIPPKPPAPPGKKEVLTADHESDFYSILIHERPWPETEYGWVFDNHIVAYMNVLIKRSMREPTPFWSKRIAFVDGWWQSSLIHDYGQFKMKPTMFMFKGNGYEVMINGRIPNHCRTNLRWYDDVDHLYGYLQTGRNHWVTYHVDLKKEKIDCYDPIFGERHLFKWADECLVEEVDDIKSLISGMNKDISEFRVNVALLQKEIEVMKTASGGKGEECMSQGRCLRNVFVCGVGMSLLCYYYYFV